MFKLMISEVNNVMQSMQKRRSGNNDSIALPNEERKVTLKHVVPFNLFPTVIILIWSCISMHREIDLVDFEKPRALIIPISVWLNHIKTIMEHFLDDCLYLWKTEQLATWWSLIYMHIDLVFNNKSQRMDTDVHQDVAAPSRLLSPWWRWDIWM